AIEKPQVKNEPPSCQNASVWIASLLRTRSTPPATVPGAAATPSGVSPTDSGESRTTHRQRGITRSTTAPAMTTYVIRQPPVMMSQVTAGTSRLMPVIEALPSTESAVPRRLLNHRATTPEAMTGPVPASPSGTSTPYTRANSQTLRTRAVSTSETTSRTVPTEQTKRTLKRSSAMPAS